MVMGVLVMDQSLFEPVTTAQHWVSLKKQTQWCIGSTKNHKNKEEEEEEEEAQSVAQNIFYFA